MKLYLQYSVYPGLCEIWTWKEVGWSIYHCWVGQGWQREETGQYCFILQTLNNLSSFQDCVKNEHGRTLNGQSVIVEWAKGGRDRKMVSKSTPTMFNMDGLMILAVYFFAFIICLEMVIICITVFHVPFLPLTYFKNKFLLWILSMQGVC